jgi:hypothetical protein
MPIVHFKMSPATIACWHLGTLGIEHLFFMSLKMKAKVLQECKRTVVHMVQSSCAHRFDPSLDLGCKKPLNAALDVNLVLSKLVEFVAQGNCASTSA